jgi:cyanophycinase
MIPKGKLLIIGGAEDKGGDDTPDMVDINDDANHLEILRELLPKKKAHCIEIITTASEEPDEMKKTYTKAFKKLGYSEIGFIDIRTKEDAHSEDYQKRIAACGCVFFTGGDQFRISTIIGGTPVDQVIKDKYMHDPDFIVAGTSAGAMAIPEIMIWEGGVEEALIDTDLKTSAGLGLLKHCIVDTHFIKRGRFGRLAHAIVINPAELGIGLGEDTALVIRKGSEATCYGSGMVVIIDGKNIVHTNITEARGDCPIYVDNLTVHLLVKGCKFSLEQREFKEAIALAKK